MRLLFLCQEFPYPPTNGTRMKPFNILKHAASRHECDLLAFGDAEDVATARIMRARGVGPRTLRVVPPRYGANVRVRQVAHLLAGNEMPSAVRWKCAPFEREITSALGRRRYDVVHLDMANMWSYGALVGNTPKVLSINDSVSRYFDLKTRTEVDGTCARLLNRRLCRIAASVEQKEFPEFQSVHVVSGAEADHLHRTAGLRNVHVIPISVENEYLDLPLPAPGVRPLVILTSGHMNLPSIARPVREFLERYWSVTRTWRVPPQWIILSGRRTREATRLSVSERPGVRVLQWVESYPDLLQQTDVALFLDSRAGGMKNRVLQALAAGRAVIATEEALEGIDGRHGEHFFIARDGEAALAYLGELTTNSCLRLTVGECGRRLVRDRYSADVVGRAWERLYERTAMERKAHAAGMAPPRLRTSAPLRYSLWSRALARYLRREANQPV